MSTVTGPATNPAPVNHEGKTGVLTSVSPKDTALASSGATNAPLDTALHTCSRVAGSVGVVTLVMANDPASFPPGNPSPTTTATASSAPGYGSNTTSNASLATAYGT